MHRLMISHGRGAQGVKRRIGGFTLMEMLIVMSMVTVIGAAAAPFFIKATETRKVRNQVETLAQSIRMARFRAVAMNREVYFEVEPSGASDFYSAYANLGNPGDVPTGTSQEIAATKIEFGDVKMGMRGNEFPEEVEFGTGAAGSSPLGGSISTAIDLPSNPLQFGRRGTAVWPDTLNTWWGTVYVRHAKDKNLVWAIGVSRSGGVRVWRWRDGQWH